MIINIILFQRQPYAYLSKRFLQHTNQFEIYTPLEAKFVMPLLYHRYCSMMNVMMLLPLGYQWKEWSFTDNDKTIAPAIRFDFTHNIYHNIDDVSLKIYSIIFGSIIMSEVITREF